jgi:hypothetical protein
MRASTTGNIHDPAAQTTQWLSRRDPGWLRWNDIAAWHLSADGCCTKCGTHCGVKQMRAAGVLAVNR